MMMHMPPYIFLIVCILCSGCSVPDTAHLQQQAKAGDATAQYEYGRRLLTGQHAPKAPHLAPGWFLAAAQKGHAKSQAALGACYHHGLGVPKQETRALYWYGKAAAQGEEHAMQFLLSCAANQQTPDAAARYLKTMLDARNTWAELFYATLILRQRPHSTIQQKKSVDYLRYAAMSGSGEAAFLLSLCYAEGYGVRRTPELMWGWLNISAGLAYEPAQYLLKQLGA